MPPRRPDRRRRWAVPRCLVAGGVQLLIRREEFRLGRSDPLDEQAKALNGLLRSFALTEYGRAHGLGSPANPAAFRTRLPLVTYESLIPYVERMKQGQTNVLWPGRCAYFAVSSGTTAGRTKYLPVTDEMLDHFRRTGLRSLLWYAARRGSARVFSGKHLFLGGSTSLSALDEARSIWAGDLSGITVRHLPAWAERLLYEPGRSIAQMSDWPRKIAAIAERTRTSDITLIAGIPSWLLVFAEVALSATGGLTQLQQLWPRLECLVHGGVPVAPFVDELRRWMGPTIEFHEVYPASEAFVAAQDAEPEAGLRLLTDAGVYYEFLPLERYDEARLGELGDAAVPLEDVVPGRDYVLVLTAPNGLCRYVLGDVVRFVGVAPPRLEYVGRTRLQLTAFGEHVIEREVTESVVAVANEGPERVANFHVAPRFIRPAAGDDRGRHEWWIEFQVDDSTPVNLDRWAGALDRELQRRNEDYEAKRAGGGMLVPVIRRVRRGGFETWLRRKGKWGGQHKLPRCRSDRAIADELQALEIERPCEAR